MFVPPSKENIWSFIEYKYDKHKQASTGNCDSTVTVSSVPTLTVSNGTEGTFLFVMFQN